MRKEWVEKAKEYYSEIAGAGYTCIGNIHIDDLEKNIKGIKMLKKGEKIFCYDINTGEKEHFVVKEGLEVLLGSEFNNKKVKLVSFDARGKELKKHEVLFVKNSEE